MKQGYIAGSLFNEADIAQRRLEGELLSEFVPTVSWFNPVDQPFNTNKQSLPTTIDIFEGDTNAIQASDYFVCDISNNDPGVLVELGIAWALGVNIIAVNSDIRMASANKYDIPSISMNHYVLGCIESGGTLVKSFDEAIKLLREFEGIE